MADLREMADFKTLAVAVMISLARLGGNSGRGCEMCLNAAAVNELPEQKLWTESGSRSRPTV
jgi:hypothetical protein